jgi:hypothetical protein
VRVHVLRDLTHRRYLADLVGVFHGDHWLSSSTGDRIVAAGPPGVRAITVSPVNGGGNACGKTNREGIYEGVAVNLCGVASNRFWHCSPQNE